MTLKCIFLTFMFLYTNHTFDKIDHLNLKQPFEVDVYLL